MSDIHSLPRPARYFPLEKGIYEVAALLRTFGSPFGNGDLDDKIFQFDSAFDTFRESKLACRKEGISKYYREADHSPEVARGIARLIIDRLTRESPRLFTYEAGNEGSSSLLCQLTGEKLFFDSEMRLVRVVSTDGLPATEYASTFDALAMQVQEDLNVLTVDSSTGRDWLSAIHVCSPSSWRPEEKIGKSFVGIHEPVPQIGPLLKASRGIVNAMVHKGPYVRFVWGLTTNPQPNHHPDPPVGVEYEEWRGKPLLQITSGAKPYMWVERQVVWGCPEVSASLFTIRASFIALEEIRANERERSLLKSSLNSMAPEVREYKGFADCFDTVMDWLG